VSKLEDEAKAFMQKKADAAERQRRRRRGETILPILVDLVELTAKLLAEGFLPEANAGNREKIILVQSEEELFVRIA
jgi:hypothetical protein